LITVLQFNKLIISGGFVFLSGCIQSLTDFPSSTTSLKETSLNNFSKEEMILVNEHRATSIICLHVSSLQISTPDRATEQRLVALHPSRTQLRQEKMDDGVIC
jgi:hypothetical protein